MTDNARSSLFPSLPRVNESIVVRVEQRTTVRDVGTVPCQDCKKPHIYYDDPKRPGARTWADPVDGHPYRSMSAEEVLAWLGERLVEVYADDLRVLSDA